MAVAVIWRTLALYHGQLARHLLVCLECRQRLLSKLFELRALAGALLCLKQCHGLVVILDHIAHVLLVEGLTMQAGEPLRHALMLCVERLGNLGPEAGRYGHQFLICRGVILNHAVGEALDIGVL